MKLKNKKTGEIGYLVACEDLEECIVANNEYASCGKYDSLAELNEEWEDVPEEPKVGYIIDPMEEDYVAADDSSGYEELDIERAKELGIWFETEEEAELAVRKLKAWKRLKDKGLRFERWGIGGEYGNTITFSEYIDYNDETRADLDICFGGKE